MNKHHKSSSLLVIGIILLVFTNWYSIPIQAGGIFFVSPGGNDSNTCDDPSAPCLTIQGALGKATPGATIKIAIGTYTGIGMKVVIISKDITLSGGWNDAFISQDGNSIIDGENIHQGLQVNAGVTASIEHFIFQNGYADGMLESYGGILNSGNLTLSYSVVQNNRCVGNCWAGGIFNYYGNMVIQWSSIIGNDCTRGGGITNFSSSTLVITNSLISQNQSDHGGGIFNQGDLTLTNSTVSHNKAKPGGNGGGIYNNSGTLSIENSTMVENEGSQSGGGINFNEDFGGTVVLKNTILADNTANTNPDCSNSIGSAGYNIISDTSGCSFSSTIGDQINIEPKLGPLQDNGGPTFTHWLYEGSPAIDGGNPGGCQDQNGNLLNNDQRGFTRPLDGDSDGNTRCDIGAYEFDPNNPPPPSPESLWYVTPTGSNSNNCHTPLTSCQTIDGAISKANTNETVYVSAGVYTTTVGSEVVLIDKNIFLSGGWDTGFTNQNSLSTIDGQTTRRGVTINQEVTAKIEHFNIQNGLSPYDANMGYVGGGLYINYRSKVTLNYSIIQGNTAGGVGPYYPSSSAGGGIGTNSFVRLTCNYCSVTGNISLGAGGGISGGGSTLILNNSIVSDNTAAGKGGGISGGGDGQIELNHSGVINNTTTSPFDGGGGINSFDSTLTLHNSYVNSNIAVSDGGGIVGHTMNIEHSLINGNKAGMGGGMRTWYSVSIRDSAVLNNTATNGNGGGIYSGGDLEIINSTIAYNKAENPFNNEANGGGIFRAGGSIQARNATIARNTAKYSGGGIGNQPAPVSLQNTLLADNHAPIGPDCTGTLSSGGYNLVEDTTSCSFASGVGDLTNIDPRLAIKYGWPATIALWYDSPAIDGGITTGCYDHQGNLITTDQIGTARPLDGNGDGSAICDIGAFEYDPFHPPHWIFLDIISK